MISYWVIYGLVLTVVCLTILLERMSQHSDQVDIVWTRIKNGIFILFVFAIGLVAIGLISSGIWGFYLVVTGQVNL